MSVAMNDPNNQIPMKIEERALERASFCRYLMAAAEHEEAQFHMPGHRGGSVYPEILRENILSLDMTELPITEDLNDPGEVLREVQHAWANVLGAEDLLFLTGGSSSGIKAGLYALAGFKGQVIALTPVHKAFFQAASLLDLTTLYLPQDEAEARERLEQAPKDFDPNVLYITSPDYFGAVLDLPKWLELVRSYYPEIKLMVDEAHGARFTWLEHIPRALEMGATLAIQSAHKSLPALTPTALALTADASLVERLLEGVQLFGTSSAPLAMAAALDYALSYMDTTGEAELKRIRELFAELFDTLQAHKIYPYREALVSSSVKPLVQDPTRVVLDVTDIGSAYDAEAFLRQRGIAVEMVDPGRLLLLSYIGQPQEEFTQLIHALIDWTLSTPPALDQAAYKNYRQALARGYFPDTHGYAPHAQGVHLNHPQKKALIPYPPGLGLYAPGETADPDLLEQLRAAGIHF